MEETIKGQPKLMKVSVDNMKSPSYSGGIIANQFIIRTDTATYFQSYSSVIVCKTHGKTYLDKSYWDYSRTTGKYRNVFLGENKKVTMEKIKSGEYILTNLN